ncbi:MAG: cupin domain-containing protein [Pyrinomonadaceae bacterium]
MKTSQSQTHDKHFVRRSADAEWIGFSPTSKTRFFDEGGPGIPDLYEDIGARGDSPPLHSHPWPSWEIVLEGKVRVQIGDEEVYLEAGDSIYVPPNVPHTVVIESETARCVGLNMSDGRFPRLQTGAVDIMSTPGDPDMARLAKHAASLEVTLLGPPIQPKTKL